MITVFLLLLQTLQFHPLGRSSINQYFAIQINKKAINLSYEADMAEMFAATERIGMDSDDDSKISITEKSNYLANKQQQFFKKFIFVLNGKKIAVHVDKAEMTFPVGEQGFPTINIRFHAFITLNWNTLKYFTLKNNNFPDTPGVKQITINIEKGIRKQVKYKLSNEKPINALPQNRGITIFFNGYNGKLAKSLNKSFNKSKNIPVNKPAYAKADMQKNKKSQKHYKNNYFYTFLSAKKITFASLLIMLIVAFFLGAVHALSPGHGKSLAAAFFIGQNASILQALYFALSITFSHIISVIFLGILAFSLQSVFMPEQIGFYIQIGSGFLVIVIGVTLFIKRFSSQKYKTHIHNNHTHDNKEAHSHAHNHSHSHTHTHSHSHTHGQMLYSVSDYARSDDTLSQVDLAELEHAKSHLSAIKLDATSTVSIKQIIALGISGGIVPCPTAIVILLVAIAFHRIALGLLLVLLFSLGLAAVLFTINILVIRLGNKFLKLSPDKRIYQWASILSAAIVTVVGIVILVAGLVNSGLI